MPFLLLKERKTIYGNNNRDKLIFLIACAGIFHDMLFVDHGVIPLNLCTESWQSHLSLHAVCESSEPVVAGDTCTHPKVRNSPACVVEGQRVSWCQDAGERLSNTNPPPLSLSACPVPAYSIPR